MSRFQRVGLSSAAVAAPGVQTLVTPATNVNGLILRTATVTSDGSGRIVGLFTGTAAPTGGRDATKNCVLSGGQAPAMLEREIFVPAGQGVYAAATVGVTQAWITYDLIP